MAANTGKVIDIYPLTPLQQSVFLQDSYNDSIVGSSQLLVWDVVGRVDVPRFEEAWEDVVRRYDILRTTFVRQEFGEAVQVVRSDVERAVDFRDMSDIAPDQREARFEDAIEDLRNTGMNVSRPPVYLYLFKLAAERFRIVLRWHEISLDIQAIGSVWRTFNEALSRSEGAPYAEAPKAKPYKGFVRWAKQQTRGSAEAYWRTKMRKNLHDKSSGAVSAPAAGGPRAYFCRRLETKADVLAEIAKTYGVGGDVVAYASVALALSRLLNRGDVVLGVLVPPPKAGAESGSVGPTLNLLPLRIATTGAQKISEWLRELERQFTEMRRHQFASRTDLQNWMGCSSISQLVDCEVLLSDGLMDVLGEDAPGVQSLRYFGDRKAALQCVIDSGNAVTVSTSGPAHRAISADPLVRRLEQTLVELSLGHDPMVRDVSGVDRGEVSSLLGFGTGAERPQDCEGTFVSRFMEQARRTPDAVALVCGTERLSYRTLDVLSNQLAHQLQELGVGPESIVGLCTGRSTDMVVGLIGILKAGGAYLPLDPDYPRDRLAYILADSKAAVIITLAQYCSVLPLGAAQTLCLDRDAARIVTYPEFPPLSRIGPDNLAYVIYTSGSTGAPKGVLGLHRAIMNRVHYDFGEKEVYAGKSSPNVIDSLWEILMPLSHGDRVVLAAGFEALDPDQMIATLAKEEVTRIILVPSLLRALLETGHDLARKLPKLRCWMVSGEAFPDWLARDFRARLPDVRLLNVYGTSEFWDVSQYELPSGQNPDQNIPIGRPFANSQLYVLDECLELAPIGVKGELYVGGAGLVRGYLGRARLTAQRFVPNPFGDGTRLYRTGDAARWRADGELEFLGRTDHQVKIRGYRVELGEIEAALMQHDAVHQAVVVLRSDISERPQLVGYVVAAAGALPALRPFLQKTLPDHMIPASFVELDAIPMTPNGKVDRKALPVPKTAQAGISASPPQTDTEKTLAGIWSDVLQIGGVDIHDNFFELGGHSLLAITIISRIRAAFKIELPFASFFETPTIHQLASKIEEIRSMIERTVGARLQRTITI